MTRRILLSLASVLVACTQPPAQAPTAASGATVPDNAGPAKASATPAVAADAHASVGQPAPDFTLNDADGKPFKLADQKGKIVVLEWFNPGCPFVKYAHGEGPLKDMAAKEIATDVVWVAINSGATGKEGAGAEASREGAKGFGMTHPVLIDEAGEVGHAYGATKTPHVYVVDPAGVLAYAGALDNAPIGEVDGGGAYVSHLGAALADIRAGRPVANAKTEPYGCSVKYAKKA